MRFAAKFLHKSAFNVELYLHGRCHIFALALHRALGYQMECMWTVVEASDSDELQEYDEEAEEAFEGEGRVVLEHAYCKRPNGTLVDASGTQTLERIMEDFSDYGCDEDGALPVTEAELDKMMASGFLGKVHPGEIDKLVQYIKVNLGVYAEGNE